MKLNKYYTLLFLVFFSCKPIEPVEFIEIKDVKINNLADNEIKIHKLAETFMYDYLSATILKSKFGVQEFIVRRAQKQASASLRNAKIRLNSIF